jgi:hypothetical protein
MTQLPEDIIDRLTAMERRIRQLSTAVATRPAPAARPLLAMLPPQDTDTARWPQTTSTAFTTIARSLCVVRQPRMRLYVATSAAGGTAGEVRVLVDGKVWGDVVAAGGAFDNTGLIAEDFRAKFGTYATVEIQARVTGGAGSVHAQPLMMYGTQS